jgi:hypothetical protein
MEKAGNNIASGGDDRERRDSGRHNLSIKGSS